MYSAHQTVTEGWRTFKSYPRLKELYLYNIGLILMAALAQIPAQSAIIEGTLLTVGFMGSVGSFICLYLSAMAIAHYIINGWVFHTAPQFLRPPSSLWRLFWKSAVIWVVAIAPLILVGILAHSFIQGGLAMILMGAVIATTAIGWFVFVMVKLYLVIPHFTANDRAPILSLLSVSEGYFWYISCIMGWLFVYGLILIVLFALFMIIFGLISILAGAAGALIAAIVSALIQITISLLCAFIAAEAYKQIVENKP